MGDRQPLLSDDGHAGRNGSSRQGRAPSSFVGNDIDREMQEQFHASIETMLTQGKTPLARRESMALLADFSSAQSLLEHGVDGYIEAVRKVLSTDLDEAVSVSFRDLQYYARKPKINSVDGYTTVASQLVRLLCGCCIVAGRALRNATRGRAPIEFEETRILKNLTGLIKPGRLTLVLGPPGCGKTSFLRAIAGKTRGIPGTVTDGDLRYNERNVYELRNPAAWVSYVGQGDEHQALLTVRETLQFAFKSRKEAFYKDRKTLDLVRFHSGEAAVNRVKMLCEIEVDIALALLGLSGCANTVIGNENLKGVSGGERRRVTMGEMLVTGSQVMCCDEISTGLDSAATYDITAYLRSAAHALRKSIVVALLQPPPEVIDLFDDILVLAEGEIIYHGPREKIQAYFEGLGFQKDEGKDLGDFIVELPTRNGLEMQLPREELERLGLPNPPENAAEFAERWRQSPMFREELRDMNVEASSVRPRVFDYDEMPTRGYFTAMWHTVRWCWTLRMRDKVQIVARVCVNIMVGLFFGSLFFQLTIDDWWLKAMLMMMALLFLSSTPIPSVQIFSQQRPIYYKHVEAKFYSASQFTLAQFLVATPFVCFDVAFFGCSLYWLCGLAPHFDVFVVFLVVCISFGVAMNMMMTMFPFITPDMDTAVVSAVLVMILTVVASGALSTESMIPVAFRWMMWVNPLAWSYRALAINEYHTPEYDHFPCSFKIVDIPLVLPVNCQKYFLSVREVRPEDWYIPAAVAVNVAAALIFVCVMIYALAYIRFDKAAQHGAVPDDEAAGSSRVSASGVKKTSEEIHRQYVSDKYLDAVSPRVLHELAAGMPMVSPVPGAGQAATTPAPRPGQLNMLQTPPKTLIIKDLWYTIPINGEPIDFLKGVSFFVTPGRMAALMGSSGAGKTTLMDVISGRKTVGYARGDILVNGEPKVQYKFVKYAGYVEQFGVHNNCSTVRESLEFSANLRLPSGTSQSVINDYVDAVLQLLELDDIPNALAGSMSMEQNKRLTLGVELVANPSIIFCDEPTSGLDARAAAIVMRVLLKVARSGRTVVCTIHQPSRVIFNFFDDLLLLKRGGEVVYFGELGSNSKKLVDYMEAVPGTKPCPKEYNPATWMLEVIGAGTGADGKAAATQKDFAQVYAKSDLKKRQDAALEQMLDGFLRGSEAGFDRPRGVSLSRGRQGSLISSPYYHQDQDSSYASLDDMEKASKNVSKYEALYVRGQHTQVKMLLKRNFQSYWRSPEFSLNRLLVVLTFTGIFACFFFNSELHNVSDVQGRIVNIFFFSSLTCIYNLYTLVPFALSRRALYYRERAANMYSVWAFNWAEGLVEIPWLIVQVFTTCPLIYFLTNLNTNEAEPIYYFFICIFLILMLMTSMGLQAASLFPDPLAAQLASIGVLMTLMTFCGIMVPRQNLPAPYLPLYYLSFFKYSSEGLMSTQFHSLTDIVCLPDGKPLELSGAALTAWEEFKTVLEFLLPQYNSTIKSFAVCTKTGTWDYNPLKFFDALLNITGIQIEAEKFVLEDFAKDYDYDNRWVDLIVLAGWIVGLRIGTFVTMYFINHQKR